MKNLILRYKLADEYVFSQLPGWKKATVNECRKLNEASRILDEFVAEVARLAESGNLIPGEKVVDKKKKRGKVKT